MQPSSYRELDGLPASPLRATHAFRLCQTCNVGDISKRHQPCLQLRLIGARSFVTIQPLCIVLTAAFPCPEPRNIRETDQPFPEPALFLLNPDGEVVIIDYSNSPFARPDLRILVEGTLLTSTSSYVTLHLIMSNRPLALLQDLSGDETGKCSGVAR